MSVALDGRISEQHGIGIPVTLTNSLWDRIGGDQTRLLDVARILEGARRAFAESLEPILGFAAPIHGQTTALVGQVSREQGESVMMISLEGEPSSISPE